MAHSEKTVYPRIGEEVIWTTLDNGLPVCVVPKKDYLRKYALFATRYGGMDMRFQLNGQWLDTPAGIAHYLEHKMFDTREGNALQELAKNGAEPNAFTSNAITCYYFDSTEKFYENLEILLSFVSVPYFTDESVEKEQGIIAQEINMIEDNPEWQVYKRLMQALYHTSPARTSVAGSVESIRQITAQTLYDCHRAFYTPANMCLVVVGDVDADKVLAAAERRYDSLPEDLTPQALEQQLCFIGLAGMIDPVRPEVKDAVAQCRAAGIRPVMITGDHKDTAVAIARELGIITDASQAVTGSALDGLSDDELDQVIDRYGVYARVQPEHKVRIVNAWRRRGAVTAMTGDGVNDAPSIKCADIGVGMGITGTDVTKNVADMVLSDDNFATIVSAVGEGRRIYDNIRKAIQFLLASNMSEVLGVFFATLLGFTLLNPVHLLFINLITDCFPALALGLEQAEPDTMTRPPRDSRDGVFAGGLGVDLAYQGVLITLITLVSYIIGHCMEVGYFEMPKGVSDDGMTMAFLTMSMCEIFHSFNMRSQRKSVFSLPSHNKVLWGAMLGSLMLTTAVLEIPVLANAFGFTPVSWPEYGIALALAFLVIPVVELVKLCQRRAAARRENR